MSSKAKPGRSSVRDTTTNSTPGKRTKSRTRSSTVGRSKDGESLRRSVSRLLVVDDEEYICEVIKEMLSSEGYHIHTTCDPRKALDWVKREPVDLVLTDLIMGETSGVGVLAATRVGVGTIVGVTAGAEESF